MTSESATGLPPIAGYHPTTLIDWPGRLAAIVFLPRCNFRCPFCHSQSLLRDPEETVPFEGILEHIRSRGGWIDGVVICGGEPTCRPNLRNLCEAFRREGLLVKLDTNGSHPDRLAELLGAGLLDAVAMDLKAPLDERYHRVAGTRVDLEAIGRSVDLLMASEDVEYEFRTTVCPTFIGEEEIRAMGSAIAGAAAWVLQRFEPTHALDPALRSVDPYSPAEMEALAETGRTYVGRCRIRGQPERQYAAADGV